jgi:hypothetical protein
MKIESNKTILEKINDLNYNINYGPLKKGSDTEIIIKVEGVSHVSITKTCQCTMPIITLLPEGGFSITIKYDPNKVGTINQSVFERVVDEKNEQSVITFNLKGLITQ